jgi:zinc protease
MRFLLARAHFRLFEVHMKKALFYYVLAAALVTGDLLGQTPAPKASSNRGTPAAEYKVPFVNKTLPNGLEVIVFPDPGLPVISVEIAVRNGSFTEPPELNGLSHLYEHMFFKTNRAIENRDSYLADIGQFGITYNGTTREEVVQYYLSATSQYLVPAVRFISDAVRYPVFDEEEFEGEKAVVIGEIDRNEANPFFYLNKALNERLFFRYPSRKNPLGTRETVSASTTAQMRLIQSRYYVPNNAALIICGDVDPDEAYRLAQQFFGDWKPSQADPFKEFPMVEHPPLPASDGYIVEQPVQNVLIQIGWHGPSIGKDNAGTYAADIFSYIVTQPDSRFQRSLVDSGLVVGVDVGYYTQRNTGPIVITLVTTPQKAKAALKALYAEIAQFDSPAYFSDTELASAKTILEARDLFDREKLSEYSHTLGFWWSSTGIEYFRGYHPALRAITRGDTDRYIRTYIKGKPHVGVALLSTESQTQARLTAEDLIGN